MDTRERRENPLLTDGVSGMQFGKRRLQQVLQKGYGLRRHPLLQRFRRDSHGQLKLGGFRC